MKQPWRSHYNAICGDWVAKHKRTTRNGVGNCSSKTGSRRQSEKKDDFEALLKNIFRRKITSAKMEKICWQITVAAFMQPLQYDLRSPAAKDNSRRKFRSQTSDNMDRWKAEQGRGREKRKIRREKIRRERVRGQKIPMREKVGKVAKHCVFPMMCGSGGSKSRLAKAAGAEPAGHRNDEKLHAVVARSTFPSQNVQNTSASDHFWKLWCRKSARRCGAKHISKSKCTTHRSSGPLLEVVMSKKCTPLWREAHLEVKSVKNWGFCAFFDVLMSKK